MKNGFWDNTPDLDLPQHVSRRREESPPTDENGIPIVYYVKIRCPYPDCEGEECPVYSSDDLPIRRHKCKKCGRTFKSIEK